MQKIIKKNKYLSYGCIDLFIIFILKQQLKKSSLYKGCLEPIILKLLNEKTRMYGYEITQQVKELTNGELKITEGALYPLLHKLEASGILKVENKNIGNRIRKYYSLTNAGKKEAKNNIKELANFIQSLNQIINIQLT